MNLVYKVWNGYRWEYCLCFKGWFLCYAFKLKKSSTKSYPLLPRLFWFGELVKNP